MDSPAPATSPAPTRTVGQRILGRRDIVRASGEERDELAVAATRDGIRHTMRVRVAVVHATGS
jgi:hypothetical protein